MKSLNYFRFRCHISVGESACIGYVGWEGSSENNFDAIILSDDTQYFMLHISETVMLSEY